MVVSNASFFVKPLGNTDNGKGLARFFLYRCHCDIMDPAWNNMLKRRKIAAHVQRESMHRDPMTHTDANGSNLTMANPNSRERFPARRRNSIFGEKLDEQLLEPAQISM